MLVTLAGAPGALGVEAATKGVGTEATLSPTSLTATTLNEYVTEFIRFKA